MSSNSQVFHSPQVESPRPGDEVPADHQRHLGLTTGMNGPSGGRGSLSPSQDGFNHSQLNASQGGPSSRVGNVASGGERAPKRRRLNDGTSSVAGPPGDFFDDSGTAPHSLSQSQALTPEWDDFFSSDSYDYTHSRQTQGFQDTNGSSGPSDVGHRLPFGFVEAAASDVQSLSQPSGRSQPATQTLDVGQRQHEVIVIGGDEDEVTMEDPAASTGASLLTAQPAVPSMAGLEAIDLTSVNDSTSLRQREQIDDETRRMRREASLKLEARRKANAQMLKSTLEQQEAENPGSNDKETGKGIGAMQCVICMDDFTDMTATPCGHLFCHTCINEHLITAEMSRNYANAKPLCPFCRTAIIRQPVRAKDKDKTVVPLLFKVKPKSQADEKDVQSSIFSSKKETPS